MTRRCGSPANLGLSLARAGWIIAADRTKRSGAESVVVATRLACQHLNWSNAANIADACIAVYVDQPY